MSDLDWALPKRLTEKLVNQPESGMGYQICVATMTDGRKVPNVVVRNSTLVVRENGSRGFKVEDIVDIEVQETP